MRERSESLAREIAPMLEIPTIGSTFRKSVDSVKSAFDGSGFSFLFYRFFFATLKDSSRTDAGMPSLS